MSIEIINDKRLWDDSVESCRNGTLFHKWDFLNIIEKYSGSKLLSYAIYQGDKLLAVFPLFYRKNAILNMITSPPFSYVPYLGPAITSEYEDLKQDKKEFMMNNIVEEFGNEVKKYSPNYTMIRTTPDFSDIRPFRWEGYITYPNYTYTINLNLTLEEIWNNFKKSCRRKIKIAEGKVSIEHSFDVSELRNLTKSRYEEQGINAPSYISSLFLAEVADRFKKYVDIYYLYDEDQTNAISCQLNVKYRERYLSWVGSVKTDLEGGNEYLEWELIKIAKSEGYKKFEENGANTKNLCKFKSKFNPNLEMGFDVYKKSFIGQFGEWCYLNFVNKM